MRYLTINDNLLYVFKDLVKKNYNN